MRYLGILLSVFTLTLSSVCALAQEAGPVLDQIELTNGSIIEASVKEVSSEEIKVQYPGEEFLEVFNVGEIAKITFGKSGRVREFSQPQNQSLPEPQPGPTSSMTVVETEPESADMMVLGGVELCGPMEDVFPFLHPKPTTDDKKANKRWAKEAERILEGATKNDNGSTSWFFRGLSDARLQFNDKSPLGATVVEFNESVAQVYLLYFTSDTDRQRGIWDEMKKTFRKLNGETTAESTFVEKWVEGEKSTVIQWDIQNDYVALIFGCVDLEQQMKRVENAQIQSEKGSVF